MAFYRPQIHAQTHLPSYHGGQQGGGGLGNPLQARGQTVSSVQDGTGNPLGDPMGTMNAMLGIYGTGKTLGQMGERAAEWLFPSPAVDFKAALLGGGMDAAAAPGLAAGTPGMTGGFGTLASTTSPQWLTASTMTGPWAATAPVAGAGAPFTAAGATGAGAGGSAGLLGGTGATGTGLLGGAGAAGTGAAATGAAGAGTAAGATGLSAALGPIGLGLGAGALLGNLFGWW